MALLSSTACSEAETPNANFDGGPVVTPGLDSGPSVGGPNEPCFRGSCDETTLACVQQDEDGGTTNICRERCDRGDPSDPCGLAMTCARLRGDAGGACLPAGGLDDDCPCDDPYACTLLRLDGGPGVDAGRVGVCKQKCPREGPDGGDVDAGCPDEESCVPLSGSTTLGVCID